MAGAKVHLPDAMRGMTLDIVVTGARQAAFRTWIGCHLLKLGARVMGCDVNVSSARTDADIIRYQPLDGGPERVVYGRRLRG